MIVVAAIVVLAVASSDLFSKKLNEGLLVATLNLEQPLADPDDNTRTQRISLSKDRNIQALPKGPPDNLQMVAIRTILPADLDVSNPLLLGNRQRSLSLLGYISTEHSQDAADWVVGTISGMNRTLHSTNEQGTQTTDAKQFGNWRFEVSARKSALNNEGFIVQERR